MRNISISKANISTPKAECGLASVQSAILVALIALAASFSPLGDGFEASIAGRASGSSASATERDVWRDLANADQLEANHPPLLGARNLAASASGDEEKWLRVEAQCTARPDVCFDTAAALSAPSDLKTVDAELLKPLFDRGVYADHDEVTRALAQANDQQSRDAIQIVLQNWAFLADANGRLHRDRIDALHYAVALDEHEASLEQPNLYRRQEYLMTRLIRIYDEVVTKRGWVGQFLSGESVSKKQINQLLSNPDVDAFKKMVLRAALRQQGLFRRVGVLFWRKDALLRGSLTSELERARWQVRRQELAESTALSVGSLAKRFAALGEAIDLLTFESKNSTSFEQLYGAHTRDRTAFEFEAIETMRSSDVLRHALGDSTKYISPGVVAALVTMAENRDISLANAVSLSRDKAEEVIETFLMLADTAAGGKRRNRHVSDKDLRTLVQDVWIRDTIPELRLAAEVLLDAGVDSMKF